MQRWRLVLGGSSNFVGLRGCVRGGVRGGAAAVIRVRFKGKILRIDWLFYGRLKINYLLVV